MISKVVKMLPYFVYIVCALLILWVGISWFDIVLDNLSANPHHYNWNLFVILVNMVN